MVLGWKRNEFWTGTAAVAAEVDADAANWLLNNDGAEKAAVTAAVETLKAGKDEGQDTEDEVADGMQLVIKFTADELIFWAAEDEVRLAPGGEKDKTVVGADTAVCVDMMPKLTEEEAAELGTNLKLDVVGNNDAPLDEVVGAAKPPAAGFDGLKTNPPPVDGKAPTLADTVERVDGGNIGLNSLQVADATDAMETNDDNDVGAVTGTTEDVTTGVAG